MNRNNRFTNEEIENEEEFEALYEYFSDKSEEFLEYITDDRNNDCPHCKLIEYFFEIYNMGKKNGLQELALGLTEQMLDIVDDISDDDEEYLN